MRIVLRFVAGGLLLAVAHAAVAAGSETAGAAPPSPFQLTRSLQALQDQIALGSEAANEAQRKLLIHISEQFLAAAPEVWREPVNARAAVVYVLSGGQPQIMRNLLALKEPPAVDRTILEGALAYATGRQDAAWSSFRDVDARALPPSLGGHVALVQASLTMDRDPAAAAAYLDLARLLAPGTLVEEAALRRQLSVASRLSNVESFEFLAKQYFRRFGRSVYAANVLRDFPDLWAALEISSGAAGFERLEATIAGLEAAERRDLYLSISRRKLSAGETGIARAAATRAATLSADGSPEALRAALYGAAANVAGEGRTAALASLREIDVARLSEADAALHRAALSIAIQVQQPPGDAALPADDAAGALTAAPVIERAREALSAADELLRRTQ